MALIIGSVFYNLPNNTGSLYGRGALIFFAILMAAFQSSLEVGKDLELHCQNIANHRQILTLYAQRPIVEKQAKYAFYHPFAEAIASMLCDLPNKVGTATVFNLALYFMTGLRREPRAFFIFYLFTFMCTLTISMYFRSIAALSRTMSQAMAPAAVFILSLIIYTGFAIPVGQMVVWFRWLNYINPVGYGFEALMINEFHNRKIPCSPSMIVPAGPAYMNVLPSQRICSTTGAAAGADFVDGDTWLQVNYQYTAGHLWRNLGLMAAIMVVGCAVYLLATEYISAQKSKGEVLLFRRGHVPESEKKGDEESNPEDRATVEAVLSRERTVPDAPVHIQKQTAIFHWDGVNYDIKIKKEPRRLLDDVDGWVKPGTLTALMGVVSFLMHQDKTSLTIRQSGAGKTTLLDVLASRVTMGVVTGSMFVDGRERDTGFQRKTGYVQVGHRRLQIHEEHDFPHKRFTNTTQQQDLHLATSTVREALNFSAVLRQPKSIPRAEQLAYVDEVIRVLEMETYADAVVGVPGEGMPLSA